VNHPGYVKQVENEYYFEDGGKIVRDLYYPKGSSKGEKISVPPGKVEPDNCSNKFRFVFQGIGCPLFLPENPIR
jgi:hypothetical protein